MAKVLLRFSRGGAVRAIHDDDFPFAELGFAPPVRASHVEPIQAGVHAGWWHADMSPLGPEYQYCLWPPCPRRDQALAAERQHIIDHWIKR